MAENYIRTENMTVRYGRMPLIRQIGVHVRAGEIMTFIGPNEAGKSIVLQSIIWRLGLLKGTVYLDDIPMKGVGERETVKGTSILTTGRVHSELTSYEDAVGTGRYPYIGRMGILTVGDRGEVRETVELAHVWGLASRDFPQISDKQRQCILLARAICQDPSVTVLGELTFFLGIQHELELPTILKDLVHRKKVAVLISLHELDLARKLSGYIVYVKGEYIERRGTPEEIFTSFCITGPYGTTKGSYYAEFGHLEMKPVKGKPQVFVIGRNESGIPAYRKPQRMGIPFVAGILYRNSMDYPTIRALASQVISEIPFEPTREETYGRAAEALASYDQVICCLKEFDTLNDKNRKLAEPGRDKQGTDLLV